MSGKGDTDVVTLDDAVTSTHRDGLISAYEFLFNAVRSNGSHIDQAFVRRAYELVTGELPGGSRAITPTIKNGQPYFTKSDLAILHEVYGLRPGVRGQEGFEGYTQDASGGSYQSAPRTGL
jgi:hypothetical protein